MESVRMVDKSIKRKVSAILQFGPATPQSGFRAGEYYQAVIDPNMVSPNGSHIRFGAYRGDEINGWQRVAAMTVAEVLSDEVPQMNQTPDGYTEDANAEVVIRHIEE